MTRREPTEAEVDYLRRKTKQQLRKRMRSIRRTLPAEARAERSARIAERVVALPAFERARRILSYMPIQSEVDPSGVVEAARAANKACALPLVDFEAGELVVHRWDEGDALEEAAFGIPEPLPSAPRLEPEEIDFVLVPALATDERGYRIGYGKGFYDQLLEMMPNAVRCAVTFDFQIIAEVPEMSHDQRVHVIATDARVITVEEGLVQ